MVVDGDPQRLLERVRAANRGGDVHLIGGPRTIETFRRLGAPEHEHALPTGAVELAHART